MCFGGVFKLCYEFQKSKDLITTEEIEKDFCGVFLVLGKQKCYEACLGKMEKRQNETSAPEWNEIGINKS